MRNYWSYSSRGDFLPKKEVVSLKKGDVILSAMPFAYVVESDRRGQYCEYCFTSNRHRNLFPCKGCGFVFYCSPGCVSQSWDDVHRRECANLKRCRAKEDAAIPNYARLLARIIFRLQEGGDKYEEMYSSNRGRKFKDLMNHYKDIKNDANRMRDVHSMMSILTRYIGAENVPNESDFIGIYGRTLVNRFCLNDELNIPFGSAVYLAASIFDHACLPNAHPSFIGKKLVIRTLVDLPYLNLDKVRISYIDCVNTCEMRRHELHRNWYFWCDCDLCGSEERDHHENCIACENPECGALVRVPERYCKSDTTEPVKIASNEDSATALKMALDATKLQFNFASVPVNPFASIDACMSYLFYDKNRYKAISESDDSDDSEEDSSPAIRETVVSPTPQPVAVTWEGQGVGGQEEESASQPGLPLVNGADDGIQASPDQQVIEGKIHARPAAAKSLAHAEKGEAKSETGSEVNGIVQEESKFATKTNSMNKKDVATSSPKKKSGETKLEKDEDISKKATGAKPKTLVRKKKSLASKDKENCVGGGTELTNGDVSHEVPLTNGTGQDTQDEVTSNGHATTERMPSAVEVAAVEQIAEVIVPLKRKKVKKLPYEKSCLQCPSCSQYFDANTLREYRSIASFSMSRLKDMKEENPNFQIVLDVLERQGKLLPSLNVWKVRALDFAFNATFGGGAWMLALDYGMKNVEAMKYYYRNNHPTLGLFFMKMAKVHLSMKLYRPGLEFLDQARRILELAMGPKHPFITVELDGLELMASEDPEIMMERRIAKQKQRVTEVVCPCCGKKKTVVMVVEEQQQERPWERDRKVLNDMKEDAQFFSSTYY